LIETIRRQRVAMGRLPLKPGETHEIDSWQFPDIHVYKQQVALTLGDSR
jgi:hypothetical protein